MSHNTHLRSVEESVIGIYNTTMIEALKTYTAATSRLSSYHCERLVIIVHIMIANLTFLLFTLDYATFVQ